MSACRRSRPTVTIDRRISHNNGSFPHILWGRTGDIPRATTGGLPRPHTSSTVGCVWCVLLDYLSCFDPDHNRSRRRDTPDASTLCQSANPRPTPSTGASWGVGAVDSAGFCRTGPAIRPLRHGANKVGKTFSPISCNLVLRPPPRVYKSRPTQGRGCSSGVERYLAKVNVVSSNLITRSNYSSPSRST